jgi:hypothetical protein
VLVVERVQASQPAAFLGNAPLVHRAKARDHLSGNPPQLVGKVLDQRRAVLVVGEHVMIVARLFEESAGGDG